MQLKADFHVHSAASWDGRSSLSQLAEKAKALGLDAIAVTDHDLCTDCSGEYPVLLLPGCEITTTHGHVLGLCLQKPLKPMQLPTPMQAVNAIRECGGVAVFAHPFSPQKAEEALLNEIPVDAIECENARVALKDPEKNAQARALAEKRGLAQIGGSDAHGADELGGCITLLECRERSVDAVREAILQGNCQAVFCHSCTWKQKGLSQWEGHRNDKNPLKVFKTLVYLTACIARDGFGGKKQ